MVSVDGSVTVAGFVSVVSVVPVFSVVMAVSVVIVVAGATGAVDVSIVAGLSVVFISYVQQSSFGLSAQKQVFPQKCSIH